MHAKMGRTGAQGREHKDSIRWACFELKPMGASYTPWVEFNSLTMVITDCKSGAFMFVDCAQIVPVKVKFSQIFPKITKNADKIYCIINTLKLCSFCAK